ncbi:MAG: HAMP domain-containing protein [Nanoarchaeota archaeon]|nr:HAMP domain-containing protein [Nanoarchaeota archaeon]
MERVLIQQNELLAGIASQSIEAGYLAKHIPFETIRSITESEDILFLWVVKPDGEVYLSDDPEMWGKKIKDDSLGIGEVIVKDSTSVGGEEHIKIIIHPLKIGESEKKWTLYLGVSLKSLTIARNKMIVINTILFVLIIFFSSIVSLYLARSVTKPIIELKNVTDELAKGNLDIRAEIKSRDEIGDLASAFNDMTSDLKKSYMHIEEHEQALENQVQQRTLELQKNVKEIEDSKQAAINMMEDVDETNKQLLEAQEKLKGYVNELESLDVKKGEFISITAHELKTPLTSIKGFADLLQNDKIAGNAKSRKNYLNIIHHDAERLGRLITDILDLSKIDLGAMRFEYSDINLRDVTDTMRNRIYPKADEKKITLNYEVPENLPTITTDADRLIQVISNIINNAIRYTSDNGRVLVSVKPGQDDFIISVKDTGMGIPKDQLDKIFNRFYQVDSSYTRKVGGSGLGLAISKGIIDAMNGRIWVESKLGKGSTFYISLPMKQKKNKDGDTGV